MGKSFLGNAFSIQMLKVFPVSVNITEVAPTDVDAAAESVIGHPDTAAVVAGILGREVECRRVSVTLSQGDVLYVAQVVGGRLPEGATRLPEGFELRFYRVTID